MLIMASIVHLGKSGLPTKVKITSLHQEDHLSDALIIPLCLQAITDDDLDRISTCIRSLWEATPLMFEIYNKACRQSLSDMLATKAAEEREYAKVSAASA